MFTREWTKSSSFTNQFTVNSEHDWEDLCI